MIWKIREIQHDDWGSIAELHTFTWLRVSGMPPPPQTITFDAIHQILKFLIMYRPFYETSQTSP